MANTELLQAALAYAKHGWSVFPLSPKGKKPLIPKKEGGRGLHDATTDVGQVQRWWDRWPEANIGVSCGPSGLVVIDLDVDKGGITEWRDLCTRLEVSPYSGVMAKTGGGGLHLLYRADQSQEIHNSAEKLGPGIDVRGAGGYIVAPPSVHPTGGKYEWYEGRSPSDRRPSLLSVRVAELLSASPEPSSDEEPEDIPEGRRDNTLTSIAGTMRRRGLSQEAILAALRIVNQRRCKPPLPDEILVQKVESVCRYRPQSDAHFTDLGNAKLLVSQHGENLRYCAAWRSWMVWDGIRWSQDPTGEVMRLAKETVLSLYFRLTQIPDKAERKAAVNHARRSEAKSRLDAMVGLAETEEGIPVRPESFDVDEWHLNVENGTIDLRRGELRPHRRGDLLSKLAPVPYDSTAQCPHWLEFLDTVFEGSDELIAYVQQMVGYALTGSTREQVFFILYGSGANGKSTFTETIAGMLGDYAQQVPTTTLMVQRPSGGDQPRADIARLKGIRFASAIETEAGRRLAEALVKQMTGGDRIAARYPYGRYFEFRPTHKTFLATNHKPRIRGTDYAIWRRVHLVPFVVTITDPIPNFGNRFLRPEWPGILRWAVQGCLDWQAAHHLAKPPAVELATQRFREEQNPVTQFIQDCCTVGEGRKIKGATLWREYREWTRTSGGYSVTRIEFGRSLEALGFGKVHRNDGVWHTGVTLGYSQDEDLERIGRTIKGD